MRIEKLKDNWKFYLGEQNIFADLQEEESIEVSVPHDWSTLYRVDEENLSGLGGGYAKTGIGWYQTKVQLNQEELHKSVVLRFDGVYQFATIYLNQKEIAKHDYGYTSFFVDCTDYIKEGENELVVKVDNSSQPNSRWYTGSGILRPVYLMVKEKVHFDYWPFYVKTGTIDYENNTAVLDIRTQVMNDDTERIATYVTHEIYDANKKLVTKCSSGSIVDAGERAEMVVMPTILDVHLWSAKSPYLYTLKSCLYDKNEIVDCQETKIGVRKIDFSNKQGFLINGVREKIKGVCIHHDCGMMGGVSLEESLRLRLQKLKRMGCNGIRCAHNPPAVELLNLCDEMGFYVMDEAFDEWQLGKVKHHAIKYSEQYSYGYNQIFKKNYKEDLTSMLHRDRNHPSIVLWSIGNEILEQSFEYSYDLVKELVSICHTEDPTRKVTSACDRISAPIEFGGASGQFEQCLDVVGYNYVDRWKDRGELLYEIDHMQYPDRCIIGSENYSAGMIRGDYTLNTNFSGFFRTQDYRFATMQHEHLWKLTATRDYIAGDFMWTGIDYLGEARWPKKGGDTAPIDTCGFEKDTYYYFKSIWNEDEYTLHIAPHWNFTDEGEYKQVIIYTNCKQVALYINGKYITTKGYEFPHRGRQTQWDQLMSKAVQSTNDLHLEFDVLYEKGELLAIGYDEDLKEVCRSRVVTTKEPVRVKANVLNEGEIQYIEVYVEDEDQQMVPNATNLICVESITGGKLIAMDNGDMLDHTLYSSEKRKLFAGKLMAVVKKEDRNEPLSVTFASSGCSSETVVL